MRHLRLCHIPYDADLCGRKMVAVYLNARVELIFYQTNLEQQFQILLCLQPFSIITVLLLFVLRISYVRFLSNH